MFRMTFCLASAASIVALASAVHASEFASFDSLAKPFLKAHCLECHGAETQEGDVSFHKLTGVDADNFGIWQRILEQVQLGEMPPKDEEQPSRLAVVQLADWVIGEFQRVKQPEGGYHEHRLPSKGNYLDHDLLFGEIPEGLEPPSSPARSWRLHPHAYLVRMSELVHHSPAYDPKRPGAYTKGDVFGLTDRLGDTRALKLVLGTDHAQGSPGSNMPTILPTLGLRVDRGLQNYPHLYSVTGADVSQIAENAKVLMGYMIHGPDPEYVVKGLPRPEWKKTYRRWYPAEFERKRSPLNDLFEETGAPNQALMEACVRHLFAQLVCRPPRALELREYTENLRLRIESQGKGKGMLTGLLPIFLHHEALFSFELAEQGKPDKYGRVMLQDQELALAINGAFGYLPPDSALQTAIREGKLKTREDAQREVARILHDDSFRKPRVLRFFQEYFDYHRVVEIGKDVNARFSHGSTERDELYWIAASKMVANTDRLVEYIVAKDRHVLSELLTTDQSVTGTHRGVKGTMRGGDIAYYGEYTGDGLPKIKKRGGGETGAVLPDGPAIHVRVPPISNMRFGAHTRKNVLFTTPADQRCGILTQPSWLISHSDAMDNHAVLRGKWVRERLLGGAIADVPITVDAMLPDEPMSTLRHRMRVTREEYCWKCHQKMDPLGLAFEMYNHVGLYRTKELGKPVDSSGEIIDSGDAQLDGKYENAIQMIHMLAKSERVHQVFVRHAFRYWMGRNETLNDVPTLQAAYKAYKDNDGSMKALLTSLLTSDSFLYRKREQSAHASK